MRVGRSDTLCSARPVTYSQGGLSLRRERRPSHTCSPRSRASPARANHPRGADVWPRCRARRGAGPVGAFGCAPVNPSPGRAGRAKRGSPRQSPRATQGVGRAARLSCRPGRGGGAFGCAHQYCPGARRPGIWECTLGGDAAAVIGRSAMLLVLDNFERSWAPPRGWLACSKVRPSSRVWSRLANRCRIRAERVIRSVRSLPWHGRRPRAIADIPSVALFVDRGQARHRVSA